MAHIHVKAGQHDATVSAFIIHESKRAVLLHRHRKLGILLQPGGHIELDEHPWATMVHELDEETGYNLDQLDVLQATALIPNLIETVHPIPLAYRSHDFPIADEKHIHTDAAFGFVTNEEPLRKPHEGESQELYWVTAEELVNMPENAMPADTRTIALFILAKLDSYQRVSALDFSH